MGKKLGAGQSMRRWKLREKRKGNWDCGGTFFRFSHGLVLYGGRFWLLLQQQADILRSPHLFWRTDTWMEEWFPSSCRTAFPPGPLVTTLLGPEFDILWILLPQMLGQSLYSGLTSRKTKALGTQLFWVALHCKGTETRKVDASCGQVRIRSKQPLSTESPGMGSEEIRHTEC